MTIHVQHPASRARRAIERVISSLARRVIQTSSEARRIQRLDELTRAVMKTEVVAVAGSLPSAYGVGWDQRPDPRWLAARESKTADSDGGRHGDDGGVPLTPSPRPTSASPFQTPAPRPRAA